MDNDNPPASFLGRQGFGTAGNDIVGMVEQVCGLNAQTPRGPIVGLRARLQEFDMGALDGLLNRYALVKANLFRGTVHLVTARQFLTWRQALQPALEKTVRAFCPGLWDRVGHDDLLAVATTVLSEDTGDGLTRAELGRRLAPVFPQADPAQLAFAVRLLAPVVQVADPSLWHPGPTRYVLASTVLDGTLTPPEAGLPDLLATYLRAYGPATAADAGYFIGLSRLHEPLMAQATILPTGSPRTPAFDDPRPLEGDVPPVVVLPEYDNVYFAHTNSHLRQARRRLIPNPATRMHGSILWHATPVAGWTPGPDRQPALDPWQPSPPEVLAGFDAFRLWYQQQSHHTPPTTTKEMR